MPMKLESGGVLIPWSMTAPISEHILLPIPKLFEMFLIHFSPACLGTDFFIYALNNVDFFVVIFGLETIAQTMAHRHTILLPTTGPTYATINRRYLDRYRVDVFAYAHSNRFGPL